MKFATITGLFLLISMGTAFGQLLDIKLGMTEEDVRLRAHTRQLNGFTLIKQTESSMVYLQETEGYKLTLTFDMQEGIVRRIKTIHSGTDTIHQKVMYDYFQETVKDWHSKSYFSPNPGIEARMLKNFSHYSPEVAAFSDPNKELLFVFLYYKTAEKAVFTSLEQMP